MEPKPSSEQRFALLIDADNVSAKYLKPIMDELSKYGTATYQAHLRRLDAHAPNMSTWKDVAAGELHHPHPAVRLHARAKTPPTRP